MMYIHCMVRTQLYLDDRAHARLHELARQQGRTISDLVREAIDRVYLTQDKDDLLAWISTDHDSPNIAHFTRLG